VIAEGLASRYADSLAGRKTASGAPYDPEARTCAHRRLRLGTVLHVRRKKTGQTVTCRVNDRGPFHDDRILDLSRAAAEALGFTGVAQVEVRKVLAPE
jgi:rare lipoprotein A